MRVHVDETRNDRLSRRVDHFVDARRATRADAGDATSLHDHGSPLDHFPMIQRHDARVGERHAAARDVARYAQL
jgi:hypothetical protein